MWAVEYRAGIEEVLGAAAAGAEARWPTFASYCRFRSVGRRRDALAELRRFLDSTENWSQARRREFVGWHLSHRPWRNVGWAEVAPHPLQEELLFPTCRDWVVESPHGLEANVFLGLMLRRTVPHVCFVEHGHEMDLGWCHLLMALDIDPSDPDIRVEACNRVLGAVGYSAHELASGHYLGDAEADLKMLRAYESLLGTLPPSTREVLANEWQEMEHVLEEFIHNRVGAS